MQSEAIIFDGLKLIQDDRFLKLTQDTALLSDFVKLKKNERVFDIGVGIGSLSILLLVKNKDIYTEGIEIIPEAAEIAMKNFENCGFAHRASVTVGDLKDIKGRGDDRVDVCVSNPPYFSLSRGKTADIDTVGNSRSEVSADIYDVVRAAKNLLKWGGRLYFCYKPERIEAAFDALLKNRFAVKRLRFVHQRANEGANLVMIEARLGGGQWCCVEPPLIVENEKSLYANCINGL